MAMERFLQYSLQHGRPIRGVLMINGVLVQKTFTVLNYSCECVSVLLGSKGTPLLLPLSDILSCDYARGDHGET